MRLRVLVLALMVSMAFSSMVCAQQQNKSDAQNTSAVQQVAKQSSGTVPQPPPDFSSNPELLTPRIPSPDEMQSSQRPVLRAAPDAPQTFLQEDGFPNLPAASGTFSISDHDKEKADAVQDLLTDALKKQGLGSDPPSINSVLTDAVASGAEKLGVVVSNDFLQKTIPAFVKSDLASGVLNGAGLLLDSEPTADSSLVNPSSVRTAQSAIMNVVSVAGGNGSPFNDATLAQACNRLQSAYAQTRFGLNATQQNQVQGLISWCDQQASSPAGQGGVSVPSGTGRAAQTLTPPQRSPKPSDCPPGAKVCH